MNLLSRLEIFYVVASVCVLIGIFANNYSRKFGIPTLLIFLIVGMLAGSDGLGGIWFDNAPLALVIGISAIIFILFNGGLDTDYEHLGPVISAGLILSTVGVVLSSMIVAFASMLILDFNFWEGLLLGAMISSTDAVAVFSVLRSKDVRLKSRLRSLIEFESASNDPIAIFLVISVLQILTIENKTTPTFIFLFLKQLLIGSFAGYVFGKIMIFVMNSCKFINENFYTIASITLVLLCYGVTQTFQGSGLLAVYFAGLILGRSTFVKKKSLIIFHDTVAWLMQVVMFLVLGLFVFPANLLEYWWQGLLLTFIVLFLARPASVFLCLVRSKFSISEKMVISWGGFRGATPIVLALYPLTEKTAHADLMFNVIFIIVFVSILIQAPSFEYVIKFWNVEHEKNYVPRFQPGFIVTQKLKSYLKELTVQPGSNFCGKNIMQLNLSETVRIVLIQRGQDVIGPRGTTVIEAEDKLLILATTEELESLKNRCKVVT